MSVNILDVEALNNTCWICRRTKEELEKNGIELQDVENMAYCGFKICQICEDFIISLSMIDDESFNNRIDTRLIDIEKAKSENLIDIINGLDDDE